jgi:hypothetical protein
VDSAFASRWTRGELRLNAGRLAFIAADGEQLFDIEVTRVQRIGRVQVGRADIVIETLAGSHPIAFGRKRLGGTRIIEAQQFWTGTLGRLANREL